MAIRSGFFLNNTTLKKLNLIVFVFLTVVLFTGQKLTSHKRIIPVEGELYFPTPLKPSPFPNISGGAPQSMRDGDFTTWFNYDTGWATGFEVRLLKKRHLKYLELYFGIQRKPKKFSVSAFQEGNWKPIYNTENMASPYNRIPINVETDRILILTTESAFQDSWIRINEFSLAAEETLPIDYLMILSEAIILLLIFNALHYLFQKQRQRWAMEVILAIFSVYIAFGQTSIDITKDTDVDYATGTVNNPGPKGYTGTLLTGFDNLTNTGILMHAHPSSGFIDYSPGHLESYGSLNFFDVATKEDRPPKVMMVQVNHGVSHSVKGEYRKKGLVRFKLDSNLAKVSNIRIRFTESDLDDYVQINDIKLNVTIPNFKLIIVFSQNIIQKIASHQYRYYVFGLIIYGLIAFSRIPGAIKIRAWIKKKHSFIWETGLYFWYALGIGYFLSYYLVIYDDQPYAHKTTLQLKYLLSVRPEIQIAAIFLTMALSACLFTFIYQKNYLDLSDRVSSKSISSHLFLFSYLVVLFHLHFFIYINSDRLIPSEFNSKMVSDKNITRSGPEPKAVYLFDGDDGTHYGSPEKLRLKFAGAKNKGLLGYSTPKWIWIGFARHEFSWDENLEVFINGNKAELIRDFSLWHLRVDIPNGIDEITYLHINRSGPTLAEISEIYMVGSHAFKYILSYCALFSFCCLLNIKLNTLKE